MGPPLATSYVGSDFQGYYKFFSRKMKAMTTGGIERNGLPIEKKTSGNFVPTFSRNVFSHLSNVRI
jgi:hypothetical protein